MQTPRYRSAGQWWLALFVITALLAAPIPVQRLAVLQQPPGSLVFFVAGLLLLFCSRPFFHAFKRAVVAFSGADARQQAQLWSQYFQARRRALLVAMLPAVAALVGRMLGLEEVPVVLLWLASLLLLWLYRTPRQLW